MTPRAVGVALIGSQGHQVSVDEVEVGGGRVVARDDLDGTSPAEAVERARNIALTDGVELVSVCVEPRAMQVGVALAVLDAGRAVLIERPVAVRLEDVEWLRSVARAAGLRVWERATTAFDPLYRRARDLVRAGAVGEVVLVTAHRSYPWADWRNPDESVSGGLALQSATYGIDAARLMIGRPVRTIRVSDTTHGEPRGATLRMAAALTVEFEGGAVASVAADYLNPPNGPWGRDELRVLGTRGTLSLDAVTREMRWVDSAGEHGEVVPPGEATLLRDILDALREGRDTDPAADSTLDSTASVLRAFQEGGRRTFLDGRWPA